MDPTITPDRLARLAADRDRRHFENGRAFGVEWACDYATFERVSAVVEATSNRRWETFYVDSYSITPRLNGAPCVIKLLRQADQWCAGFVSGVREVYDALNALGGS